MKKTSLFILMVLLCNALHAQNDSIKTKQQVVIYSFFYNMVPNRFNFPLIGFVNMAMGNHQGLQLGFINTNLENFNGAQVGFVNTTLQDVNGVQYGFVNTTQNKISGGQIGFVNTVKEANGFQVGFVNTTLETKGFQAGFVNISKERIKGSQIGFINYADTITGVPIGFISIVKKGGYKAIEISANEYYPVNLSFKIGVPKLYSFLQFGYNSGFDQNFAFGAGLGSLVPIGKNLYFNPEIGTSNPISSKDYFHQFLSFTGNFRYNLCSHLQIAIGSSITWEHSDKEGKLFDPVYSIINHKINDKNRLVVGARAALSFDF